MILTYQIGQLLVQSAMQGRHISSGLTVESYIIYNIQLSSSSYNDIKK